MSKRAISNCYNGVQKIETIKSPENFLRVRYTDVKLHKENTCLPASRSANHHTNTVFCLLTVLELAEG